MSSIIDVLSQIRGGAALTDANKELRAVVMAVKSTGKKGSITLKIDIEPDKTDETVVTFQPDVTIKVPRKPYAKGLFYVSENGDVSREDPRQTELDLERAEKLADQGVTALAKVGRG